MDVFHQEKAKLRLAKDLGVTADQVRPAIFTGTSGPGICYESKLDSIKVGNVEEKNVEVLFLSDLDADGLLGMSFPGRFKFSIDSKNRLLQLRAK